MNTTTISKETRTLYNSTKANASKVGNKAYAYIPVDLLFADDRYQRVTTSSKAKVRQLATSWDDDRLDTLKVAPHDDEYRFSIIDGFHRLSAAQLKGIEALPCEILMEVPKNKDERLMWEAQIFTKQDDRKERVSPQQKHKANVLLGVYENVELEKMLKKYNISIYKDKKCDKGYLRGFKRMLEIVRANKEYASYIFDAIKMAGWNYNPYGYRDENITFIYNIVKTHNENKDIVSIIGDVLRELDPDLYKSSAVAKYPERKPVESMTLFMEDQLVNAGIERKIFPDKIAA